MLAGSAADHFAGFRAHSDDHVVVIDGNHGGLLHHDALALDVDHHVGGAQVDTDFHAAALCPFRKPFDPGAELQEFRVDLLIAAVYVVRAANRGHALGSQSRQDKRRAGSEIADLDIHPAEPRRAMDGGVMTVRDLDLGAHAAKLAEPLQAVLENRLGDVAVASAWVSSTHVGGWRSVARPGYGCVSMSAHLNG